jgi:translocation and assembly module TamB
MRRSIKQLAWVVSASILGTVLTCAVVLVAVVLVAGNTAPGRAAIERLTLWLTAGQVELVALSGRFPGDLQLAALQLHDRRGVWLRADRIRLQWSPWALLERRISVENLQIMRLDVERAPESDPSSGGPVSVPHIDVARFSVDVLELGAALAGSPASFSARGGGRMRSLEDADGFGVVQRLDGGGQYTLQFKFDRARMDGTLAIQEPASGPLENILQLPGLGALVATLNVSGARNAERIDLQLRAGALSASLNGSVDLPQAAADLDYSLDAPAMRPRADLGWQRIALHGRWRGPWAAPTADGALQIEQLRVPGGTQIAALRADLTSAAGGLALRAVVDGLRLPGPAGALFASDPLRIDASMRVSDPSRPLTVIATHRLLTLSAQAITAGRQSLRLDLRLADIAPFAALAGQNVLGDATLKAQLERRRSSWGLTLDGDAGLTGGSASWLGIVGHRVTLQLSGSISDAALAVERLQLAGSAWTLSARATASNDIKALDVQWDLHLSDLGIVSSALAGTLQAAGQLRGVPAALAADVTLKSTVSIRGSPPGTLSAALHARGLPSSPSFTIKAGGTFDGSPLDLAASLERDAGHAPRVIIQRAAWKSAHLDGAWTMESGIAGSHGRFLLQLDRLSDLDRLIGTDIQGSLDGSLVIAPVGGRTHLQFELDGRDLVLQAYSGSLQLTGEGTPDSMGLHSLGLQLKLQSPKLAGAPATLSANADLDLDDQALRLLSATASFRGQQARLLSPGRLSYGNALAIDRLDVGLQDGVLQLQGQLSPLLDLRASVKHVGPKLINVLMPDAVTEGTIEGQARLQGSWSAPTGRITLTARGLRSASDAAVGFPALDVDASADLAGGASSIEVRMNAGTASSLSVTGTAPLHTGGDFDLKIQGKMDIGIANPLLEARGIRVGGQLAVDATVRGNIDAPEIRGAITLAQGNLRDYARGFDLTHINAQIEGSQATLQIKSFNAAAAAGTVALRGSIGLLQPGMPVDLEIIANQAQAITSNLITANVDADIKVTGAARQRIAVAGSINVNRAVIGIPDSLPPDVAVLDVRRRGKAVPVAAKPLQIDLDLSVRAQRQIIVQGRGLDAELGSDAGLHVGGTVDTPLVSGDFDLQRGTFTIGSTKLSFSAGRVTFNGAGLKQNIDPSLEFTTAQTTAANITAFLRVTGYADSPKFEFISVPAGAPQDEILSVLLFGEPVTQLTALQAAQIGVAVATLSGVGVNGLNPLIRIQRGLGLDRLSVGTGTTTTATGATQNSGAAIAAGRYITKRVYVEGTQTTTGQSQVQIAVDLTKHLKVQTRLGNGTAIQGTTPENDPGSSVGLSYQFEF